MARKNICFYPKLNDEMFDCIFDKENTSISFSYIVNDEIKMIDFDDTNDNISFDKNVDWNCDDYNLEISINIKLKNLKTLFGSAGIAPSNSKIGLAIEWYSAQAKIRNVTKSQNLISQNDNELSFVFDISLPKQTFTGTVSLNALLYLAESSDNVSNEWVTFTGASVEIATKYGFNITSQNLSTAGKFCHVQFKLTKK